jgi:hypothetical protein
LEPLVSSIKQCLEHRHSYVRRNAALAVYSIHKSYGEQLLPDGPELMEKFIASESDISARRNAFLMLFNEAESIAIDFLSDNIDIIASFGDGFALLVLELSRKVSYWFVFLRFVPSLFFLYTSFYFGVYCRYAAKIQLRKLVLSVFSFSYSVVRALQFPMRLPGPSSLSQQLPPL